MGGLGDFLFFFCLAFIQLVYFIEACSKEARYRDKSESLKNNKSNVGLYPFMV